MRGRRSPEAKVVGKSKGIIGLAGKVSTKADGAVGGLEFLDAALDLWAEVAHEALNGPCSGVTQRANSAALDLFPVRKREKLVRGCSKTRQHATYVISRSMSISRALLRPSTMRSIIFIIQVVPSRQGVH